MEKHSKIYIAGHEGFVGSALKRELERQSHGNLVCRCSSEVDLTDAKQTEEFFMQEKPEYVFLAAATAGGIKGIMENPVDFLENNIRIQNNILRNSWKSNVRKLLFLGSSCVYPVNAEQPFSEDAILTGAIERTIEPYAIAKIAGIRLCQYYNRQYKTNFITIIPASLYGPNDTFFSDDSHFMPALIRRFHEAKVKNLETVTLWGSGRQRREIMYVDDAAKACVFLMNNYSFSKPVNAGVGRDHSIEEIGRKIGQIVGFNGRLEFDRTKPDGITRKIMDSGKINAIGWYPEIDLDEGLKMTYEWFLENVAKD